MECQECHRRQDTTTTWAVRLHIGQTVPPVGLVPVLAKEACVAVVINISNICDSFKTLAMPQSGEQQYQTTTTDANTISIRGEYPHQDPISDKHNLGAMPAAFINLSGLQILCGVLGCSGGDHLMFIPCCILHQACFTAAGRSGSSWLSEQGRAAQTLIQLPAGAILLPPASPLSRVGRSTYISCAVGVDCVA